MELTRKQQARKELFEKNREGLYTNRQLAMELSLSISRIKAIKRDWKLRGDIAFIHGNTGRKPAHAVTPEEERRIIEIKEEVKFGKKLYNNVNFAHFTDILNEDYRIKRCHNTIAKVLVKYSYESPKIRRTKKEIKIHFRRPRRPHFGELLQADGSSYDWFEDGNSYCIHAFVDDATGRPVGMYMTKNECAFGYIEVVRQVLINYGVWMELYPDKHGVFFVNSNKKTKEEIETGKKPLTQFGKIIQQLGVDMYPAHSPEAKGRIERFWETIKSRLPVELKREGITTPEEANKYFPKFMEKYNKWFAVEPKEKDSAFVPITQEQLDMLSELLAVRVERKTDNAGILSLNGYTFFAEKCRKEKIVIYLSIKDGIYGVKKNGIRVAVNLLETDEHNPHMPIVWKELIEEYYFKDEKAKYRLPYKRAG